MIKFPFDKQKSEIIRKIATTIWNVFKLRTTKRIESLKENLLNGMHSRHSKDVTKGTSMYFWFV